MFDLQGLARPHSPLSLIDKNGFEAIFSSKPNRQFQAIVFWRLLRHITGFVEVIHGLEPFC